MGRIARASSLSDEASYRRILSSTWTMGGASLVNVALGVIRAKAAALLLGPAGLGLIGLLTNLITAAAALLGFGIAGSATRHVAAERAARGEFGEAAARRALFVATLVLAALAGVIVWAVRGPIAALLGDRSLAGAVGWCAIGVALAIAAASQTALLAGLGRIRDVAGAAIVGGLIGTIAAIAALFAWGDGAILAYVLAGPAAAFLAGAIYTARLTRPASVPAGWTELLGQWRGLAGLAVATTLTGLMLNGGVLIVRALVNQSLGLTELGLFHAAWTIAMTYLGFVLQAMATDFYPRLSAVHDDAAAVNRLVNQQTEVGLLLGTPVVLLLLGLAPWVIRLFYAAEFEEAQHILRWQMLGDVLKLASWPLGFILLASARGSRYVLLEGAGVAVLVLATAVLLPVVGIVATGVAVLIMYAAYLPLAHHMARRTTAFRWTPQVRRDLALSLFLAIGIFLLAGIDGQAGAAGALAATAAWMFAAWRRLGGLLRGGAQ